MSDLIQITHGQGEVLAEIMKGAILKLQDLTDEIAKLRAAQCWVIVDSEGNTVDGPFFTEDQAKENLSIMEHDPGCFDKFMSWKVVPWEGGK